GQTGVDCRQSVVLTYSVVETSHLCHLLVLGEDMQVSLRKTVALAAVSASVLVPALAAPAMASPAKAPLQASAIPTMQFGDRGPAVKQLQERLTAMHYDPGTIDGIWGNN